MTDVVAPRGIKVWVAPEFSGSKAIEMESFGLMAANMVPGGVADRIRVYVDGNGFATMQLTVFRGGKPHWASRALRSPVFYEMAAIPFKDLLRMDVMILVEQAVAWKALAP